ncbi:MAG: T9SS type A sorting domain-containing protein [Bacteroidia bacterium]|nr:T9SS type A sorting domain-containing protein [Bacteroidia bacterium]
MEYYTMTSETYRIEARLYYQTVSKEYAEFLRDQNQTDTKGQEFYDLWVNYGRSVPELMVEQEFFTSTLDVATVDAFEDALKIYPNPTQDMIYIEFGINSETEVKIELYGLNGAMINTIHEGYIRKDQPISWSTAKIAPGMYIIKLRSKQQTINHKLIKR